MVVAAIATGYGFGAPPTRESKPQSARYELRIEKLKLNFDPACDDDLIQLAHIATRLSETEPKPGGSKKKLRRGLEEVQRTAERALHSSGDERTHATTLLLETVAVINNSQRRPVPARLDFVQVPFVFVGHMHRPIGHGHSAANDLEYQREPIAGGDGDTKPHDLSRLDPAPSTFWSRPADIPAQDLYHGFGRTNIYQLDGKLCIYSKAKDSYGSNPGFEVSCDGAEFKIKFGEVSSEPFTARIFAALGFHADPTDYSGDIALRYDRRIFQEFHSRQPLKTRFTLFGVLPLYVQDLQKRYDPFACIASAELRDGARWTGRELKARLLRHSTRAHPEDDSANFRTDIEEQIARLFTVPANVQMKDTKSIGPWDFGQLDHAGRRELRGAGLLAAWLGWFDTRFDNTRLRIVRYDGADVELLHYFSDLGGGLGNTSGLLYWRGEHPNEFPWEFTRATFAHGNDSTPRSFQIVGYKPMAYTAAFAEMTIDDARWMARLIAQLTEKQIVEALIGSGYSAAEVRLYQEKLISRRDRMIVDLGLAGEIPLLRPQGVNRHFSYDPRVEAPVSVEVRGVAEVRAPIGEGRIVDGKIGSHAEVSLERNRRK
jgi:hypothetical protein